MLQQITTFSTNHRLSQLSCPDEMLCTESEVTELLMTLDIAKASGLDGISARMLIKRNCRVYISPSLIKMFNLSIKTGSFPSLWKRSNIVLIPKANDNHNPSNYRPISLLSILGKLLEKHVHHIIAKHVSKNPQFANVQWGFQSGKSTVALLATTYDWFQKLDSGKEVCAAFFDIQKAFDTIPHHALMQKLQYAGLNNHILHRICSYLTNREQKVLVNGATSNSLPVISGVPQGSVLGPLLFLIYIDGVTSAPLSDGSKMTLYADDMLLYRQVESPQDYQKLQDDIHSISEWVSANHLHLNVSKCKTMLISRKRTGLEAPPLLINGHTLEQVECFKYLDLLLTSELSWSPHIETACSKARKLLGTIYRRFSEHSSPDTLLHLYESMV